MPAPKKKLLIITSSSIIISSESKMDPMTKGEEKQYCYNVEEPPVP
jgi:hypothetical protein